MTPIETRARYLAGTLRGLLLGPPELRSATSADDPYWLEPLGTPLSAEGAVRRSALRARSAPHRQRFALTLFGRDYTVPRAAPRTVATVELIVAPTAFPSRRTIRVRRIARRRTARSTTAET
jgi:hypothetical protein